MTGRAILVSLIMVLATATITARADDRVPGRYVPAGPPVAAQQPMPPAIMVEVKAGWVSNALAVGGTLLGALLGVIGAVLVARDQRRHAEAVNARERNEQAGAAAMFTRAEISRLMGHARVTRDLVETLRQTGDAYVSFPITQTRFGNPEIMHDQIAAISRQSPDLAGAILDITRDFRHFRDLLAPYRQKDFFVLAQGATVTLSDALLLFIGDCEQVLEAFSLWPDAVAIRERLVGPGT